MNKVLAGQVLHSVGHLSAEGEQLGGEGGGDGERAAGGRRWSNTQADPTTLRGPGERKIPPKHH